MPPTGTLAAELRELDEMMKRNKFHNVLVTLKECITNIPVTDTRSINALETYLHLIDLSFEEVDREQRKYREWLEGAVRNRRGISDETLGRLKEYRRRMGAETDEELIEELLKIVEVRTG